MMGGRRLVAFGLIVTVTLSLAAGCAATGPIGDGTSTYEEDPVTVHAAAQQALRSSGFQIERSSALEEDSYRVVGLLDDAQTARSPTGGAAVLRVQVRIEPEEENGHTVVSTRAEEDANYGGSGAITEHQDRFFENLDRVLAESSPAEAGN